MNLLSEIGAAAWQLMLEMAPYLMLGFFLAGLLHVLISPARVARFMGTKGIGSSVRAAMLGVPLPLCSCGVIPTGISFFKNGAGKGATNSFLISTPQTGVDSIILTYSLMGPVWAIARPIVALITGIAGGVVTDKFDPDMPLPSTSTETPKTSKLPWFLRIFKYAFVDFLADIARPLLTGIAFAIAITLLIPDDFFTTYLSNPLLNMLLILVAAVPMYVCATGSIPIAAALLAAGVSPGAVLVFLMAGPATNVATITVLWKVLGRKSTLVYLFTIITGALFFGILIDYGLPKSWFAFHAADPMHTHQHGYDWLAISCAVALIALIIVAELRKLSFFHSKSKPMSHTYTVEGMTCNHCKAAVEKAAMQVAGITSAEAIPSENKLIVEGEANDAKLKAVVEGLGYTFKG